MAKIINLNLNSLLKELKKNKASKKDKSNNFSRFFKTGPGQYGEGDMFIGITVPISRQIAQRYTNLSLDEISKLLENKYHEARLIALLILVQKYKLFKKQASSKGKKEITDFYLKHTKYINNWDLVDQTAGYLLGDYLIDKDRKILIKLAKSNNLWERRIAIISTFAFIYNKESDWTLKIVDILIEDKHDLIQKACGWMLREVGKRVSENDLIKYLDTHHEKMPRTMLRYSIERLPEKTRLYYLNL